jgi:hypothetical protein
MIKGLKKGKCEYWRTRPNEFLGCDKTEEESKTCSAKASDGDNNLVV